MEDDFGAENLEDGELWLPSDFFSTDEVHEVSTNFNYSTFSNAKPYCMNQFSNSSSPFLERHYPHHYSEPLPALQRFKPADRVGYAGDGVHDFCGGGTGISLTGCSPIHRYQRLNPVQNFMGERAWSLQNQQQENRFALNRVLPGLGTGGYGGTGVFLPRVSSNSISTANVGINHNYYCFRKGQGTIIMRHGNEIR
ncbi:hypothetical protein ACJIZ3_021729 [Penstemon smallii]|uniref:Uncharacterized protein n=1 Tax=Penstemon smallii TaxID=265156 RepID=A0ABD3SMV3_9LAMI